MDATLLIPAYQRAELLRVGLWSLAQQDIKSKLEVIVLNDGIEDATAAVCREYRRVFNLQYIFTGKRNKLGCMRPRVPGFAFNIGIKQARGKVVILSNPEMLSLNNTVDLIVAPHAAEAKVMTTVSKIFHDKTGETTKYVMDNFKEKPIAALAATMPRPVEWADTARMPYFMGIKRTDLIDIGGYDEDFTGYAGDDSDLIRRLICHGFHYCRTQAKVVHLYHGKSFDGKLHWENPAWVHNYKLLLERQGKVVRNKCREWGKLD